MPRPSLFDYSTGIHLELTTSCARTYAFRVDAVTGNIYTVAGNYFLKDDSYAALGDGLPATNAALSYARGIAVDAAGNLFIADWGHDIIRKVTV